MTLHPHNLITLHPPPSRSNLLACQSKKSPQGEKSILNSQFTIHSLSTLNWLEEAEGGDKTIEPKGV